MYSVVQGSSEAMPGVQPPGGAKASSYVDVEAEDFTDETDSAEPDDEGKARAIALRALLIDELDAKKTEGRIKRRWPDLKDKAQEIVDSAQRTAEKWKPGVIRTISGMQKRITTIALLNERFVMVQVRGQPSSIAHLSDALFLSRDDFSERLADSVIVTGVDRKGSVQAKDASKFWRSDCRRRVANKIVFTSRQVGPDCLNLWTGFGVSPKEGRCDLIYRHIHEVICSGNEQDHEAFLNLLAWIVQNIGKPSRIIVTLQSKEQQVGKGLLLEKVLHPIFGLHGIIIDDSEHLFGQFNDAVRGKAFAFLDEANFAGDKKLADKIKSIVAKTEMTIEGKFAPKIACPVGLNLFLATNHEHAARVELYDARNWILKVSPHRKNDHAYWAELYDEIDKGGPAFLLHDLLARDVSKFNPQRDVPIMNAEHEANRRASNPADPALWLLECLDNKLWLGSENWIGPYSHIHIKKDRKGMLEMANGPSEEKMLPTFLESSYRQWASVQGRQAQAVTKGEFWRRLTDFGFERQRTGDVRTRVVPEAEKLRAKIAEHQGFDDGETEDESAGDSR